ncbi:MAG TPA: GntR family transcriptional regulator [Actinomycetes bacterium]|jgi:GntR family transcriptional regulator|nr:GntR family transcriptional regulator [Actinomycetes bacterium]
MQTAQQGTRARPRLRSVSVQDELRQRLDRGRFPAGTRLPSEPDLAAELRVSRATLREALRALEDEGLLLRRRGSGTYVAERPRVANSLDLNFGVTEAIRAAGMRAGIAQGRQWVEPASVGEAARLELEPGQDVLVVERVRTAEGKPVVLSRDVLPSRLVGDRAQVVEAMLHRSIYEVLERDLGVVIHHGVARFRPVRADHAVADRLGVPRGELLLYLWQVDYAEDGAAVLSSHEFHLADAFDFSVVRRGPGRRFT